MQEQLNIIIKAQYPLIYLVTSEEERAEKAIAAVAQTNPPRQVFSWTVTHGMGELGQAATQHSTLSPEAALDGAIKHRESAIFIFKDLHPFLQSSPAVIRWLRDAIANFKGTQKSIILMSPIQFVPIELEKEIVVLDFALPTLPELEEVLIAQNYSQIKTLTPEAKEKLLRAALGLTRDEAEKVYRKALVTNGKLSETEVEIVLSEKQQLIRRNGILEYVEYEEGINSVGGLEELKRWLKQRANAFSQKARDYGLPQPKGMMILGIPGCGKSLIAKTTSKLWALPLVKLDMGRVYDGSTVGRSEANLRNALKAAESISPVILFIDELDKAFAGGSADSDGGTSSRIFGTFLTWMQEKKSPVFVMATANRADRLPAEFLRKGRFDEIFFVDLPDFDERRQVFEIHLERRRRDVTRFDLDQLSHISEGFSGAEIEQAIIAAMYDAFAQDREFTQLDIISAVKSTTPLSRTMTEQVTALRDWAKLRARPAATTFAEYQRMEF